MKLDNENDDRGGSESPLRGICLLRPMKRILLVFAFLLTSMSLLAQQAPSPDVVATVNGENITRAHLDQLWSGMSEKMRAQYEKSGNGKRGFLDNYIRKRLLLQKAQKEGFAKSPAVQAELDTAKEAALFDLYVRDVVASPYVNEAVMRKFYQDHRSSFLRGDQAKVRLILVKTGQRTAQEARARIAQAMQEVFQAKVAAAHDSQKLVQAFAAAARKYSDHPSGPDGGDLGWIERDKLEKPVADAAFALKPGTMSGIIEADDGMHLVLTEEHRNGALESYESARPIIREYLLSQNAQKVLESVNKMTQELVKSGKVVVYPDNID